MRDRLSAAPPRGIVITVLTLMTALAPIEPCYSQQPYPPSILAVAASFKGLPVNGYTVDGLDGSLAGDLVDGLALQSRRRFLKRQRSILSVDLLEDDLRRTLLFLARNGYPRASLNPHIFPVSDRRAVVIVLDIQPGNRIAVGEVALEEFPSADGWPTQELDVGMRFSEARVDTTAALLRSELRDRGFAFAEVRLSLEPMDSTRVRVRFVAEPGLRYRFGLSHVQGTQDDLARLVRRMVTIPEGTVYSPGVVARIEERIRLLDLFRRVQVGLESRPDTSGVVDLRIELSDLDPRTIEGAIGLRTDEGLLLRAGWLHRNLLGGGRGLLTRALYSRHLRSVNAWLWFPGLMRAALRQELRSGAEWQREENYDLDKYELEVSTRYYHSFRSAAQIGLRESISSYRQLSPDGVELSAKHEVASLAFATLGVDGSDNRMDPQKGWVTSLRAESTVPGIRSDVRYAVVDASLALYRPVMGAVAAAKIRAGRVWAFEGTTDLPPDVRFYAGGATSMRGFARRKLGPLDDEGNPLGGTTLMEAALELRVPVVSPLTLAGFIDAGQVWSEAQAARLREVEVAVGGGIRIATPVGHIRVDAARRLTDFIAGPAWAYHLALGQPF